MPLVILNGLRFGIVYPLLVACFIFSIVNNKEDISYNSGWMFFIVGWNAANPENELCLKQPHKKAEGVTLQLF